MGFAFSLFEGGVEFGFFFACWLGSYRRLRQRHEHDRLDMIRYDGTN